LVAPPFYPVWQTPKHFSFDLKEFTRESSTGKRTSRRFDSSLSAVVSPVFFGYNIELPYWSLGGKRAHGNMDTGAEKMSEFWREIAERDAEWQDIIHKQVRKQRK
jgi:hypothetical protein